MDRLEVIREIVDKKLNKIHDNENRKYAYLHLYGVCYFASMLAVKQNINVEYCSVAAMLHDIAYYVNNCGQQEHALKSSLAAKDILESTNIFNKEEIQLLTTMIAKHSDKLQKDNNVYIEVLKNADVLAHYFYNVNIPIPENDKVRLFYLLEGITS